ncbi:MAG: tyrosine-type recombinase/integrase [Pseudobdellovibrionaceae bacterium]
MSARQDFALVLWIEFFEDLEHVRGRSLNTVMAYRRDLELWLTYKQNSNSILQFYDFMKKQGLSPRSQARVISSLRTYYKYIEANGHDAPELRELKTPKLKMTLPKVLSSEDFFKLLQSCQVEHQEKTLRNQLVLLFLYGLGCRVSELVGLNLHDYSASGKWVKILGKGNKERIVPLTETLSNHLDQYLKVARPVLLKEASTSILVNDRGHRPSRVDIWRWLAQWSKNAGFSEPVNPHRFRHGCATVLLENGADLRSIQMILGHSSLQTTQIYTQVSTTKMKQAIDDHHPLSGIEADDFIEEL